MIHFIKCAWLELHPNVIINAFRKTKFLIGSRTDPTTTIDDEISQNKINEFNFDSDGIRIILFKNCPIGMGGPNLKLHQTVEKDNEEDDTAGISESISQTTPTIDEADKCLQTPEMFVFTRPVPSEEMRECVTRMSSIFSKELIKERKVKQCKIYDFLLTKSENI